MLRPIFCENPSPFSREWLTQELARCYEMKETRAKTFISAGERTGHLLAQKDGLYPRGMTKRDAVAHLLAGYPDGLGWKRAGELLAKSGVCKTPVLSSQPTQEFSHNRYLYLVGPGRYRHRRFLETADVDMPQMLRKIRAFIIENGMPSANLQTIHHNVSACADLDYFTLRHLVSVHGEKERLYFDGRSRSDSVALEEGGDRASQKRHVYDMLKLAGAPVSFKQITQSVLARNESSARQLLDFLRREGLAARTDTSTYATLEVARGIHDFEALARAINAALANAGKPVDLRAVRERYNGSVQSKRRSAADIVHARRSALFSVRLRAGGAASQGLACVARSDRQGAAAVFESQARLCGAAQAAGDGGGGGGVDVGGAGAVVERAADVDTALGRRRFKARARDGKRAARLTRSVHLVRLLSGGMALGKRGGGSRQAEGIPLSYCCRFNMETANGAGAERLKSSAMRW